MTISGLAGTSWPWNVFPVFVYDEDVIYNAFSDIIFTALEERKMNTQYGGEVNRVVFENKGPLLSALAQREITRAIRTHLPIVTLRNIDVREGEKDNDPVDIVIDYEFQGIKRQSTILVSP